MAVFLKLFIDININKCRFFTFSDKINKHKSKANNTNTNLANPPDCTRINSKSSHMTEPPLPHWLHCYLSPS